MVKSLPVSRLQPCGSDLRSLLCWLLKIRTTRYIVAIYAYYGGGLNRVRIKLLLKGDTIEELNSQMNVPPDVIKETVDRYNSFVDAGKDLDFGRVHW